VATTELVSSLIEAGRRLVEELDKQNARVGSAFWNYDPDVGEWRLMLSMPMVERQGVSAAYDHIGRAMTAAGIRNLYLRQIAPVSPHERVVTAVSRMIRTRPEAIGAIRLSRNLVGEEWIEDAYVYRST
jgi:hypothetical protein